jgi:phage gpG-like protein
MKLDDNAIRYITKGLLQPTEKSIELMKLIGQKLDQNTQTTFRLLGARDGHPRWLDYNRGRGHLPGGSTQYPNGRWKPRPGTDGARTRKYSAASKMLQASGGFRKSFGVIQTENDKITYGVQSDWEDLAGNIIKDHGAVREVLFVTDNEYEGYQRLALAWFVKNINI